MIDLETLEAPRLTLKDVAEIAGVNLSTAWRWCLNGVCGEKLRSFRVGKKRYVTRDELQRFIGAINAPDDGSEPREAQPSAAAARRADEAEAQAKAIVG